MGLLLVLIGLVLLLTHQLFTFAVILIIVGLVLFFVPAVPYGYSSMNRRRGPPPV